MDKNINHSGYNLYEIDENQWAIDAKDGPFYSGSFEAVVIYAKLKFGFELEEIEYAVTQMVTNDHNSSHFGMMKKFLYTFQKEFKNDKRAG